MIQKIKFCFFLFALIFAGFLCSCNGMYSSSSSIYLKLPYGKICNSREEVTGSEISYNFEIFCKSFSNSDNVYTASGKSGDSVVFEVIPDTYEISCNVYDLKGVLVYEGNTHAKVDANEEVQVSIPLKSVNKTVVEPENVTITISIDKMNGDGSSCGNLHDYGFENEDSEGKIAVPEGKTLFKVIKDDEIKINSCEWYWNGEKMNSSQDYVLIDEASIDNYPVGIYLLECILELEDGCVVDIQAEINVVAPVYV